MNCSCSCLCRRLLLDGAGASFHGMVDHCSECGGKVLINLHQDVQTCGYQDVQVMWDMLSSDTTAGASTPKQRPFWPASSGATAAVAQ